MIPKPIHIHTYEHALTHAQVCRHTPVLHIRYKEKETYRDHHTQTRAKLFIAMGKNPHLHNISNTSFTVYLGSTSR